jgi:uncharacterized glyoxalase superfamily protein PhnB
MTQKSIEVVVQPDGSLKIEALGFQGADCEKATAFLEKALGTTLTRKRKAERYQATAAKSTQKVGT